VRARGAALLDALDERLPGAREHADATADYSLAVAAELGLAAARCELVAEVARLHDVGKLYLPSELFRDEPPLSEEERLRLDVHPRTGHVLLLGAGVSEEPASWVLHQAERFDGGGRAELAGEAIPVESRIISVTCGYHRLTGSMSGEQALAELRQAAGGLLDPAAVAALDSVVGRAAF
jgi:HD-GYP domain-containing protein (c-di-GMP phosphodiesterase class II)